MNNITSKHERLWAAFPKAKRSWMLVVWLNIIVIFYIIFAVITLGISTVSYARTPEIISGISLILSVLMLVGAYHSFRLGLVAAAAFTAAQFFNPSLNILAGALYCWIFYRLYKLKVPDAQPVTQPLQSGNHAIVQKKIRFIIMPLVLTIWIATIGFFTARVTISKPSSDDFGNWGAGLFYFFLVGITLVASEVIGSMNSTQPSYKKSIRVLGIISTLLALTLLL